MHRQTAFLGAAAALASRALLGVAQATGFYRFRVGGFLIGPSSPIWIG